MSLVIHFSNLFRTFLYSNKEQRFGIAAGDIQSIISLFLYATSYFYIDGNFEKFQHFDILIDNLKKTVTVRRIRYS